MSTSPPAQSPTTPTLLRSPPKKKHQTVQDQIRLWERETQRVALTASYWYSNFESATLFERSRAFAQQRGLLLWESAEKQQIVVTAEGGWCRVGAFA
jgi:hypothetical protein